MAQSEMGGISGFLLVFPGVIALTHEWTDFVRRLVAVATHAFIRKEQLPIGKLCKVALN